MNPRDTGHAREPQGDTCAAYGCPMLAAIGVGGQWLCACHWRAPVAAFDAITAELHRHKNLVERATTARRMGEGRAAIIEPEDALVALTGELGQQYAFTTHEAKHGPQHGPKRGPVIGPTTPPEHWRDDEGHREPGSDDE